ncbi:MAG: hypothetical protein KAT90_03940, partial [Gammaproteobacteria bacterium]|nr:hypothetical protein [Gammaproteobacteria bacterium]
MNKTGADFNKTVTATHDSLANSGFEVVGEYSPYDGTHIIIVTNDALKKNSTHSEMGGFGAVQRVAITQVNDRVQVSATNPSYMANIYHMKSDLSKVSKQLITALGGNAKEYGRRQGLTANSLKKYQYKPVMPSFYEIYKLARFASHNEAIEKVEIGLAAGIAGTSKVYRVDIPEKEEVVFGIAMTKGCSSDKYIMERIDGEALRGSAHLPYEILVTKAEALSLHPKFRIAQSFPDLNMMVGDYTFFNIMCAPAAIEDVLMEMLGEE